MRNWEDLHGVVGYIMAFIIWVNNRVILFWEEKTHCGKILNLANMKVSSINCQRSIKLRACQDLSESETAAKYKSTVLMKNVHKTSVNLIKKFFPITAALQPPNAKVTSSLGCWFHLGEIGLVNIWQTFVKQLQAKNLNFICYKRWC